MANLDDMAEAYDAKTQYMPEHWESGVDDKKGEFREGIAALIPGASPADISASRVDAWVSGVEGAEAQYKSAIQDKGSKLAKNFKRAFTAS